MLHIENHGPLIVASNFWQTEMALAGKLYCSCNAGAIRLLVPAVLQAHINEMRSSKYVICSRGPWPAEGIPEAVELLFEDNSESPYCLHLSSESFDALPAEPPPDREWTVSVWTEKKGKPHRALERPCHWRRVSQIPCLKPWQEK